MRATLFLVGGLLILGADPAWAEPDGLALAKARFEKEPKVAQVVDVALRYFRVHPEVMDELRSKSHTRAFLPLLATGFRFDDDRYARVETQRPDPNLNIDETTNTRQNAISVGAVWDLRELVFNPAEVQIYGLIGVQRDIMLEATRTYYLRKQLVLRKLYKPVEDPMAAAALDMRIDEFTAILDVLTGGWFSKQQSGIQAE
ncbi:MAG: hypothetical protein IPG45_11470 [Deltaproteobacteria bacterium]|jgi:hypothetical protein|nr:hypothetical protein [Deltaproteobacteria bacterium]